MLGINLYLLAEAGNVVKLLLVTQKAVKLNSRLPVIQVSFEIENKALDAHSAAVADRGTHTDIGDRYMLRAVVKDDLCGIHTVAGYDNALGYLHINSRGAHFRAEMIA